MLRLILVPCCLRLPLTALCLLPLLLVLPQHKSQGPAKYSYKKTYPEKETETSYKSEYKGSEQPKSSYKAGGTGKGTVYTYNSGKRHFEYTGECCPMLAWLV